METYQDYLAHHGIAGQKWGKRNGPPYPLDEEDHSAAEKKAKKEYRSAKRDYKKAVKFNRKESGLIASTSVSKMNLSSKRNEYVDQARMNMIKARINKNAIKKGGTENDYKKAYAKELFKYGLPNSVKDVQTGGLGSKLTSSISNEHGEAFANDVLKKVKNKAVTTFAVAAAVTIGSYAVEMYLLNKS